MYIKRKIICSLRIEVLQVQETKRSGRLVKTWNEVVKSDMLDCGVLKKCSRK